MHWEDSKKAKDQEAGIDARERVGRKTARATSAMRTAQQLHQHQEDAGDDASGNFTKEGKSARQLCQEVNLPRMATLPRKASLPKTAISPRRAMSLRRAALLQPSKWTDVKKRSEFAPCCIHNRHGWPLKLL